MKYALAGIILGLGLAGCATQPVYQAANGSSYGYVDQQIETDRYRVSYNGSTSTPRATVENFLLYRMSEITLEQGYDYFKVLETDTECHTELIETTDSDPCAGSMGYGGLFSYYGYGVCCDSKTLTKESKRYEAVAFISLFNGEKPTDDAFAFDARAVIENLEDQVRP